jgi:hypothetical protein
VELDREELEIVGVMLVMVVAYRGEAELEVPNRDDCVADVELDEDSRIDMDVAVFA